MITKGPGQLMLAPWLVGLACDRYVERRDRPSPFAM